MMIVPRARPGRPRDEDVTPKVISATLSLLEGKGAVGLRIDDVVRASGVAKTTIYRRWPSLTSLIIAAMETAMRPRHLLVETGDVEADMEALMRSVHRSITQTPFARALPLISMELMQHPELGDQYRKQIVFPMLDQGYHLVRRGVEQGIFRSDTDPAMVTETLASSIFFQRIVFQRNISLDSYLEILKMVIRAIRV